MAPELSIAMPVYNEAAVIERVIKELVVEITNRFETAEIVVANDCSTDDTAAVLDRCAVELPVVTVIHSPDNRGHGPTMRSAMNATSGEWIFQIDSDGQFVASDFWKLWDAREDADLVLGCRVQRHDPAHRLLLTRVVRSVVSLLASRKLQDANVPFKLIRRSWWDEASELIPADALAPSIMISLAAAIRGDRIAEIPIRHLARPHGTSTLRLWRLMKFSGRGLTQIVRFRRSLRR